MFLIICISLAVIPFLTLHGYDSRQPKEFFALLAVLVISLWGLYSGDIKKLDNNWLYLFIGWAYLSIWFIPHFTGLYNMNSLNLDGIWNFKPVLYVLVYFVALIVISSRSFVPVEIGIILKVMMYASFVMAGYCFFQYFGIEQFFRALPIRPESLPESSKVIGTMGNPTLVSPFLIIGVWTAVYFKKYLSAAFIAVVVLMTRSDVAIVALALSICYFLSHGDLRRGMILTFVIGLSGVVLWHFHPLNDNGRFGLWSMVYSDLVNPIESVHKVCYFLTGWGIGAFPYMFSVLHGQESIWTNPHNEYLAVFYGTGFIGLALFIRSIWSFIKDGWKLTDHLSRCLMTCMVSLFLCACGTFVWHLGVYCLYSVVIIGVMYQLIKKEGVAHG